MTNNNIHNPNITHQEHSPFVIIMIGPPGVGKGTQSTMISSKYSIPTLSSGDVIRKILNSNNNSPDIENIRATVSAGKLISDKEVVGLMGKRMDEEDCFRGFILDGFPRNFAQAVIVDNLLEQKGFSQKNIIIINISLQKELLLQRIIGRFACKNCGQIYNKYFLKTKVDGVCDKCGGIEFFSRPDDREDVVKNRMEVYEQETSPIIAHYSKSANYIEVDGGLGDKEQILKYISDQIESRRKNNF